MIKPYGNGYLLKPPRSEDGLPKEYTKSLYWVYDQVFQDHPPKMDSDGVLWPAVGNRYRWDYSRGFGDYLHIYLYDYTTGEQVDSTICHMTDEDFIRYQRALQLLYTYSSAYEELESEHLIYNMLGMKRGGGFLANLVGWRQRTGTETEKDAH